VSAREQLSGALQRARSGEGRVAAGSTLDVWIRAGIRNAILIGLIATVVLFTLLTDKFLTVDNWKNILVQLSYTTVVAVPMALLLISGRVDLSVGSTLALGGVVAGLLMTSGVNTILACAAGVAAGAVIGVINGVLVGYLGFSTIIVTLGGLTAIRGFVLSISPGPLLGFDEGFIELGEGELLGIPYLVLIAGAVLLAGAIVLAQTPIGRHIYAIGVNEEAARLSGVRVKRVLIATFIATGAAAGLAGVMLAARLGSAPSGSLGVGFELDVLTAVLLGGVAFAGGRGTMRGVVFGLLFIGVIKNGLVLLNVPSAMTLMLTGLVLVLAAGLDVLEVRGEARRPALRGAGSGEEGGPPPGERNE
jgi:ribose transport system permease protein